jgi:hypothetical protein
LSGGPGADRADYRTDPAPITVAGQLRYQYVTDQNGIEHTIIAGNVNAIGQGNGLAADFEIDLVGRHTLSASEFVL